MSTNMSKYILAIIVLSLFLFFITKLINIHLFKNDNHKKKKIKIILFAISLLIYFLFNVFWIVFVNPRIVGDALHVCDIANVFLSRK